MDKIFKRTVLDNSDKIIRLWMTEIDSLKVQKYKDRISDELFESTNREFINHIFSSIKDQSSTTTLDEYTEKLINLG